MSLYTRIKSLSISLETFNENWKSRVEQSMKGLSVDGRKQLMHRKYNLERRGKTIKSFQPSEELKKELSKLESKLDWFVITEDWCGDSSYNLSVIESIANTSDLINLQIVERDNDTEIIDHFLTNGGRAIPILLSYNEEGELLFKWGPRPQNQIDYRKSLVDQGFEKQEITKKVIEAYDNGAWINVESEILNHIKNLK